MTEPIPARSPSPRPIAWADGRVLPASEATIPLGDAGFLWGDALTTVVPVRAGRTHGLDRHLAGLRASARVLGIRVPVLRRATVDLLAAWGDRDGSLRIVVTRSGLVRGIVSAVTPPASVALELVPLTWDRPLAGVRTVARAAEQWARRQAVAAHADDALIVDGDTVMELPTSALCVVMGGRVRTPDPAAHPIRDSASVAELSLIVEVERTTLTTDDLDRADEVFVVSATRPVVPVHAIGDREFPTPGRVTRDLRERYTAHLDATLDPLP